MRGDLRPGKTEIDTSSGTIGKLDDVRFREVIKAIGYALDSDCEPT
jgi:hypothetical protein